MMHSDSQKKKAGSQSRQIGISSTESLPAALTKQIPTPTPRYAQSLGPQERSKHRAKIAFDVEVVLQGYWQTPLSEQMKMAVLKDWCDELEDWPCEAVHRALRSWRDSNPSKKPNPAHISAILKAERGRAWAAEQPRHEPQELGNRPTKEQAAEILRRAGFRVNQFGGVYSPEGEA